VIGTRVLCPQATAFGFHQHVKMLSNHSVALFAVIIIFYRQFVIFFDMFGFAETFQYLTFVN